MENEKEKTETTTPVDSTKKELSSDNMFAHIKKLSLRDNDIIVLFYTDKVNTSQLLKLKKELADAKINNFVLAVEKNMAVGKIKSTDFIKMFKGMIEAKKTLNTVIELGLMKKSDVLVLMQEAAIQRNKTADQLYNEYIATIHTPLKGSNIK